MRSSRVLSAVLTALLAVLMGIGPAPAVASVRRPAGRIGDGARAVASAEPLVVSAIQQAKLTGASGMQYFGVCVAISGDTALVGMPYENEYSGPGAAYVFVRSGDTWSQQARLTASDAAAYDWFGYSVALSGDTAVIGSQHDDVGSNIDQGSAYVFTRSGTSWSQQAKLTADDGAADGKLGASVALSGETAVVGGAGSAYVFTRSGTSWAQEAKLPAAGDWFGFSVALSDDTAIVGAPDTSNVHGARGSAYVFSRSGTSWSQQAVLTASDAADGDCFGYSVAVSGDTALVGPEQDSVGSSFHQGSAYVFTRSGTGWTQQAHLTASDGSAYDCFGSSVGLSGDTAVIGSPYDGGGGVPANAHGSAYVFSRSGTTWSQQTKLMSSDAAAGDRFGYSVAVSDGTAIAGAPYDTVNSLVGQGSAGVFLLAPPPRTYDAVFGPGRCDTAAEASKRAFPTPGSADTIVLATGWNWPDALGGSSLAGAYGGPLLLTKPDALSSQVVDEARRLDVHRVVILGSNKAVSDAVEAALHSLDVNGHGLEVSRVGGVDRFETAAYVASETVSVMAANHVTYDGTAFFATGDNFPDALAASSLAAKKGWPILLVKPTGPSVPTEGAIGRLGISRGIMLGSDKTVTKAVADRLTQLLPAPPERLYGLNRYTTGIAVARFGVANGLHWDGLALAIGTNFPDALAGGVMQGKLGSVVLLTPGTTLDANVSAELTAHKDSISTVRYLGSTASLGQPVRDAVEAALQ